MTALSVCVLAVIIGRAAVALGPSTPTHADQIKFSPEFFEAEGFDTRPQLLAHRVALSVCLSGALLAGAWWARRPHARLRVGWFAGLILATGAVLASVEVFHTARYWVDYFGPRLHYYGFAVCGIAIVVVLERILGRNAAWVPRCLAIALVLAFMLAGFVLPQDLTDRGPQGVAFLEGHFTLMPGTAGRLASGLHPFTEVKLVYGLVLPVFFSGVEKLQGALNMGQYMTIVQALQVGFLILALIAYRLWRPRDAWYLAGCLLLILPYLQTLGDGVSYPNLSAWRNMNLAAGALILIASRKLQARTRAFVLGAAGAIGILYNIETGIAVCAGFACFLVVSRSRHAEREIARDVMYAGLAGLVAVAGFAVCGRLILGSWPLPSADQLSAQFAGLGSGSIGGRPFTFWALTALALAICLHAGAVAVCGSIVWFRRRLSFDGAVKVSLSVVLLVWAGYFVNRPVNGWYLWTLVFLYSFLLSDFAEWARRAVATGRTRWTRPVLTSLVLLLLIPFVAESNTSAIREIKTHIAERSRPARIWSGVRVRPAIAEALEEKVNFLRGQQAGTFVYFTANTFTIPQASRLYPRLPVQDVYVETMLRSDYDKVVAAVKSLRPARILIEPEASPFFFADTQKRLFQRLRKDITVGYSPSGVMHRWEVWDFKRPLSAAAE